MTTVFIIMLLARVIVNVGLFLIALATAISLSEYTREMTIRSFSTHLRKRPFIVKALIAASFTLGIERLLSGCAIIYIWHTSSFTPTQFSIYTFYSLLDILSAPTLIVLFMAIWGFGFESEDN